MKPTAAAVISAFLLAACTPQANGRNAGSNPPNTPTVKKGTTMEQVRNRCRSMLHKVESRDDLIKQMYETAFKDDCLYAMYANELRDIWQIPVILEYDNMQKNQDLESPIGLYVVLSHTQSKTSLYITQTKKYKNSKGSIFPENKFPVFFPKPKTKEIPEALYVDTEYWAKRNDDDPIQERTHYYWRENGREIIATNSGSGAILALEFCSNLKMSSME